MPKIEAQLLGIPCVKLDGEAVSFPFKRVDALFYYLACRRTTTRQELVNLLWADCSEETGYKNLRHTIYTLRKVLGADLVLTAPKTEVRLNPGRELVCDFDGPGPHGEAGMGQFLQGFTVKNAPNFNAWVDEVREQMSTRALNGLASGAADALARGDLAEAERLSLEYLGRDGLDEKMVMFLMRLYQQDGRFYKAASLYQQLKGKLAEELGIAPLHETAALYYEIVNQWNRTAADDAPPSELTGSRAELLGKIQSRYQRFLEGFKAPSLLFYGEAGCGKSYLLQHFLRSGDFSRVLVLSGSCAQMEAGSYLASWKNVMLALAEDVLRRGLQIPESTRRTIARVFPVFSSGAEEPRREPYEFPRNRCGALVADAVALLLSLAADGQRILLVFEDLQWMDPAGQDLLCQVLRALGGRQLLLLATSRTLNVDVNFLVDGALLERVLVPCLTEEETADFLASALGAEIAPALRDKLYEATAGNPRLLADAAENLRGKDPSEEFLPDPNSILRQRLAGLSEKALRLANVLALSRDRTPCRLLSAVTGFSVEELYPLSVELEEHSLIREECVDGESCLGFLYPHMRDALYQSQSYFQRQPLHLQIADYLEAHLEEGGGDVFQRLAYHCAEGGDGLRAFRYQVICLDAHTRGTLEIPPLSAGPPVAALPDGLAPEEFTARLELELVQLRRQYPESRELGRLEAVLKCAKARLLIAAGRYQEGLALTERLLQELTPCPAEDTDLLLAVLRQRAAYDLQTDQTESRCIAHGLEIAEQAGRKLWYADYLLLRGIDFCKRGEYESSGYFLCKALDQLDHPRTRHPAFAAYARAWQGECRRRQRDFAGAGAAYAEALELAADLGFWPGCAFVRTCYGRAALALGDDERAEQLFASARDAYAHTGELPGRGLAQAYGAWYAAKRRQYGEAAALLAASRESASLQSSLVEQGIRDSVLAQLRRGLDQSGDTDNDLHRYLSRPLDLYCHRGLQRLRGARGAYEGEQLEDCLRFSIRQAKPLTVENLYSKNKNFMTE